MNVKRVLITGASTGIGRACALRLANSGWAVFGGVRKKEDGESLRRDSQGAIRAVQLDVTDESSVRAATTVVESAIEENDVLALVNNAGITVAGPLELLSTADVRRQFEVNLFGPIAVTRALLPLLRTHAGRIVLMGSIFSRISMPFVAPYSASKAAMAAVAESLSLELRTWKIPVILIEPGNVSTPIWTRTRTAVFDSLRGFDPQKLSLYRDALESFGRLAESYASGGIGADRVARIVARALQARTPRRRYAAGWDSRFLGRLAPIVPPRFRQWILARMTLRR